MSKMDLKLRDMIFIHPVIRIKYNTSIQQQLKLPEEKCDIKDIYDLNMCIEPGERMPLPDIVHLPDKSIHRIRLYVRHMIIIHRLKGA